MLLLWHYVGIRLWFLKLGWNIYVLLMTKHLHVLFNQRFIIQQESLSVLTILNDFMIIEEMNLLIIRRLRHIIPIERKVILIIWGHITSVILEGRFLRHEDLRNKLSQATLIRRGYGQVVFPATFVSSSGLIHLGCWLITAQVHLVSHYVHDVLLLFGHNSILMVVGFDGRGFEFRLLPCSILSHLSHLHVGLVHQQMRVVNDRVLSIIWVFNVLHVTQVLPRHCGYLALVVPVMSRHGHLLLPWRLQMWMVVEDAVFSTHLAVLVDV